VKTTIPIQIEKTKAIPPKTTPTMLTESLEDLSTQIQVVDPSVIDPEVVEVTGTVPLHESEEAYCSSSARSVDEQVIFHEEPSAVFLKHSPELTK